MQDLGNQSEGQLGILDLNLAGNIQGRVFRNNQTGSSAAAGGLEKLLIFNVGNVSFAGRIQAGDARNYDRAIARNAALDVRSKFRSCQSFTWHSVLCGQILQRGQLNRECL